MLVTYMYFEFLKNMYEFRELVIIKGIKIEGFLVKFEGSSSKDPLNVYSRQMSPNLATFSSLKSCSVRGITLRRS